MNFKKITIGILICFFSILASAAYVPPNSVGGGITNNSPNVTLSGTFSGNGGGLTLSGTNIVTGGGVTNGTPTVNFGVYSIVTYGVTNPVDVINTFQHPQAGGHYVYSLPFNGYTNSVNTNIQMFVDPFGDWEIGTNRADANETAQYYIYAGANTFPTNDPSNWYSDNNNGGISPIPRSVDVGTLSKSNLTINYIGPAGVSNINMDASGQAFINYSDYSGNKLLQDQVEYGPGGGNFRLNFYSWPAFPTWTNDNNAAHNYSPGIAVWRMNGGFDNAANGLAPDARGVLEVGTVFGVVVLTNNAPDLSHSEDNGGILEYLVSRNRTNSTSVQSGKFVHPLKIDGLGRVQLGNIPEAEHTIYAPGPAWVTVREGTAKVPQLLLSKTPIYTGPVTNGFFYSDGLWMHVFHNGSDQYVLSGTTPNNGTSLTNIGSSGLNFNSNPHIPTAVTLTGSVFTFSNATPSVLECYFSSGGAAYSVSKNGVGVYASLSVDNYFLLQPTNVCAITYPGTAPTFYTNSMF